ncbi:MAG: tyrosine-type recombinase/integrase [Lachnospiraceae bacterium]|nr:tyrosine-type recombinase/integrase [Lachnospiraceae bacterium]
MDIDICSIDIKALQSISECGNLSVDTADELLRMLKKEKERKVLEKHNYKISGPFTSGNRVVYTTRAPWLSSRKASRNRYEDLIDLLYDHYYGNSFEDLTVSEIFERMIADYNEAHLVSHLTLVHYKADWDKYIVKKNCQWLDMPISKVRPEQILEHYRRLTAGEAMKRSTFNNVKTVVNAVFDYAIKKNVDCIKASHVSTRRLRFAPIVDKWNGVYTIEDKRKIQKVCEELRPTVYIKAIELMFCLDVRIGELRALQKGDVDIAKKTIDISHQMVDIETETANRHPVRSNIMKGKQEAGKRIEPLSERALSAIAWLFENYPDSVWLLPNRSGNGPIYTNGFNTNLKKVCEMAGVKYFSSHGIRFHNISAMYDAGISEKEIQRLSGHTTADMTRHYNRRVSVACEDDKIREVLG